MIAQRPTFTGYRFAVGLSNLSEHDVHNIIRQYTAKAKEDPNLTDFTFYVGMPGVVYGREAYILAEATYDASCFNEAASRKDIVALMDKFKNRNATVDLFSQELRFIQW